MAFNLPPFWSPGVALPDYVRVEDLQRGAFRTRQMPRGTYDPEAVGNGGYAVPRYVMEEGTGQGVFVTAMMPRGTRQRVGHFLQQPRARLVATTKASGEGTNYHITNQTEHASVHDNPLQTYGRKVADHVVSAIKKVPPLHRKSALKALLHKIDPKLWTRVQATATKAAKAGVPAPRALHHAIATEFRGGMVRELQQIGTSGQVKTRSQVGLGCWGCAAIGLGDDAAAPGHWERGKAGQLTANTCGYVWVGPAPSPPPPSGCLPVRVHPVGEQRTDLPIGAPIAAGTTIPCGMKDATGNLIVPCNANLPLPKTVSVGPLTFMAGTRDHRYRYTDPKQVPKPIMDWANQQTGQHVGGGAGSYGPAENFWFGYLYKLDPDYYSTDETKIPGKPIVDSITDPVQPSVPYGIYLYLRGPDPHCDAMGCGTPLLSLVYAPMDLAAGGSGILDQIGKGLGSVGGFVSGAAQAIGDAACQALQTPGAGMAATVAGGPAAGAGAAIAAQQCGGKTAPSTPAAPISPVSSGPDLTTLLLLGGAGLAAIYLLKGGD